MPLENCTAWNGGCKGPARKQQGPSLLRRWLRFSLVGGVGLSLQLTLLWWLVQQLGLGYRWGTLLAVEGAILHNFLWHQLWTWQDRPCPDLKAGLCRLLGHHMANGFLSLAGNLVMMEILVRGYGLPLLPANLVAVACCALLNFAASHLLVFQKWGAESR